MVIGSHNSMTYLKPRHWYGWLTTLAGTSVYSRGCTPAGRTDCTSLMQIVILYDFI